MFDWIPHALAQAPTALTPPPECDFATGNIHFECIPPYLNMLVGVVVSFTAGLSVLLLMINGFRWMLGPVGPEQSTDAAKKGVLNALIGLVVSLLAYIIIETIVSFVTK